MSQHIQIIDNFLPQAYQDALQHLMLSINFSWYLNRITAYPYSTDVARNTTTDSPQFTHIFFEDGQKRSEHFNLISLVMYHLMLTENVDTTELLRAKANLNILINNYPKDHHYVAHRDYDELTKFTTAIYYVNDSDGDTKFFDDDGRIVRSVAPKKGRLVYFDGSINHAGRPPINTNVRCVINFNFKAKEIK